MEGHGKECEPDDPMELRGEAALGNARLMLGCVIEEFLDQGFSAAQVAVLFESPFYQAAHGLLKIFGRDAVLQAIQEKVAQSVSFHIQEVSTDGTPEGGEYGQGL